MNIHPTISDIALAIICVFVVLAYFNGFRNGYDKAYHRHELYHYYLGAKYFPEMGYDGTMAWGSRRGRAPPRQAEGM